MNTNVKADTGTRWTPLAVAAAFFFSTLGTLRAETNYWEERSAARSRRVSSGGTAPLLLAQLPLSQPLSIFESAVRSSSARVPLLGASPIPNWARAAVTPYADVRTVKEGRGPGPRVYLVMDAHDVFSAQRNVARLLAHLGSQGGMLVGVEGTSGPFDLERHRGLLPESDQVRLADHLLKKGFINGSEAYGLTANRTPDLWGVEDPALYEANVRAYRDTLSLAEETRRVLHVLRKETRLRQTQVFSESLQILDREVQSLHDNGGDLARYAQVICANAGNIGPQARRFLEAKSREDALSFSSVEQARAAFIERMSPRLSPVEMEGLIRETTAFRAGAQSAKVYYQTLETLARAKGIPLSAYPAFREYIDYVSLADGIDPAALLEELESLERRAYDRLSSPNSRALIEWSRDLRLIDRTVQHALTPREWASFQERREALSRLSERASALGLPRGPMETLQAHLPRYAAFFEAAEARDRSLLENGLAEARRRGASTLALVTGGFHAPALEKLLLADQTPFAVFSPKVDEVPESAADYLQAFAPTRTPLEQLLLGDRLFMNPPSATAVAGQRESDPFHEGQVALNRATLSYGAVLAGQRGRLAAFVELWNQRLGAKSRAAVQSVKKGVVELLTFRFAGAGQDLLLAMPGSTSGTVRESDVLQEAVKARGGRVVETDEVGDVPYVLGGKIITRALPEILSGTAFLGWLGASALSPPLWLAGLAASVIFGGIALRALNLASVYWHGLGHAAIVQAFGGQPVRTSLAEYGQRLPWTHLVPFSTFFLPGVTAPGKAPKFDEVNLTGARRRIAALAGPAMNLLAFGLLAPLGAFTGPWGVADLALGAAAGVNLWTALTSVSDIRTAITGLGRAFYCGVIGVVYGGPNAKAEMMPTGVQHLMDESVLRTLHRGGQSGGIAVVGVKENGHAEFTFFVEKRAKEGNRRARLGELMRDATAQLARRAGKAGFGGLRRLLVVGHTRYGTNLAQPVALNAHPHLGTNDTDTIIYIGEKNRVDNYERPWERPRGLSAVKSIPMTRGVAIAHNGDDNATVLYHYGDKDVVLTNDEDALLNERMTGFKNPAKGDSPQIATRMERWITQGSVAASLRLTLLMVAMESLRGQATPFETILERAPTPALMETLLQSQALQTFPDVVKALHRAHPEAGLEDMFRSAGARVGAPDEVWDLETAIPFAAGSDIEKQRTALAAQAQSILQSAPWFMELSETEQHRLAARFAELFLKFFFTGDFRRAGIHLLRRADSTSTFGVMAGTLLEAEGALWLRQNQPFYLWVSADGKSVAGSSEAKAFLGAKSGESPFRYRLTLRNGEVATLRGSRLVIDHVDHGRVTEFDLSEMDKVIAQPRWLDLETSPYVSPSSSLTVAPEHRVREDLEMIPWVNQKIKEDFADPQSNNSLSGRAFVDLLMQRLAKRRAGQKGGELDLVIVGTEKSYDAAVLHAKALSKLASLAGKPLNIQVVYGAEFTGEDLEDLRNKGFGPDTVVMGLASSGQTANTLYALESLNMAWRGLRESLPGVSGDATPPHFLVSADMDNPYTEEVLGQGLAAGDPFKARNFVTFPTLDSFHPAEAATVTHKATERLLKEVSVLFAETLAQKSGRWKNGGLGKTVPAAIRQMVDNGDELDRRITGLDADGNPHRVLRQTAERNDIPDQIDAVAGRMSQAFLESLWATAATALFVSLTLLLHATPATLLMGWFPNQAFLFSAGLPVLAAIVGAGLLGGAAWKARLWRWHPLLMGLGAVVFVSAGLFLGESLVLGLDSLGALLGKGALGSRWGFLPVPLDVSPVNLMNAVTYVFFFFGFTLGLRKLQGRPLWDRLGGRILVLSDYQHSVARLSAARWRRILSHRFGWMGLNSINESSLGRLTHEEALNSNVRGNLFLLGEARHAEGPTLMNYKQLGGSPNGPGRIWRMGIGHKSKDAASEAYSEGYISLTMKGDNPAGEDPALGTLQELLQDAPARDTAGMVLSLVVAEKMSSIKPLGFVPGMTSSEAKTSTTQQPFPPLSEEEVRRVFGLTLKPTEGKVASPRQDVDKARTEIEEPLAFPYTIDLEDLNNPADVTAETEGPIKEVGEKLNQSGTWPDAQREGLLALAKFLKLSHQESESTDQLERDIRIKLSSINQIDIPTEHEVALVFALLKAETYVTLTYEDESIDVISLESFRDRRSHNRIPEWDSFRVVCKEGSFLLSETPIDMGSKAAEVESSDHRAGLLALAGYLKLSGVELLQDGPLAEKIEEALKASPGEIVQIPAKFEDGLMAVFAHSQQGKSSSVLTFFNNGRGNSFPESLDAFLRKRGHMTTPWENFHVAYRDSGHGVRFFSVFPNTEVAKDILAVAEEAEDRVNVSGPVVSMDESQPVLPSVTDRASLLSLAEYLGVLVGPEDSAAEVAAQIQTVLQFSGTVNLPADHASAFYGVLELTEAAWFPIADDSRVQSRLSATYPSTLPGSLQVHWNGSEFKVFTTPNQPVALEEKAAEGAEAPTQSRGAKIYPWIVRPLRKTAKATAAALALVMLTSFGGSVLSLVDRGLAAVFDVPAAVQPSGGRVSEAQAEDRVAPGRHSVKERTTIEARPMVSVQTETAFVGTRVTGLRSFSHHPYAGVRVMGRVEPKTYVNVLGQESGWVQVRTTAGTVGWVSSRSLFGLQGERALVVGRGTSLYDQRPFSRGVSRGSLPKGSSVTVLERQGGWAKVQPLDAPAASPVWVFARYLRPGAPTSGPTRIETPLSSTSSSDPVPVVLGTSAGPMEMALLLGPVVPLLGSLERRPVPLSRSPGSLLRRRLMAEARRPFAGEDRPLAQSLLDYVESPTDSDRVSRALRVTLGYGALSGTSWGNNALYSDYLQTRESLLGGEKPTRKEGIALSRLARAASSWTRGDAPSFVPGALPVIDLTSAEEETHLLHHWAVALDRMSKGGEAPVLVARSARQQARLMAALSQWRAANPGLGLRADSAAVSRWVLLDDAGADVAQRDAAGTIVSVRLGALLKAAEVHLSGVRAVDLASGVRSPVSWDRGDLPATVVVRLIIGVLKNLSLAAPLEAAQNAMGSARRTLTAA